MRRFFFALANKTMDNNDSLRGYAIKEWFNSNNIQLLLIVYT